MKNLSFFVSAFALFASSASAQTINCGALPTCDSLGYTDTVANCPNSNKVIICPFDAAKGKCLHTAEIGDVKYSLQNKDHDGWLLCDGRILKQADYSLLYGVIQQKFCSKFTAKTQQAYTASKTGYVGGKCTSGNFALPDYRGFYLRSMMTARSDSIDAHSSGFYSNALYHMGGAVNEWDNYHTEHTPMFARLPNITGTGGWLEDNQSKRNYASYITGAFYHDCTSTSYLGSGESDTNNCTMNFDASKSNSIYSRTSPYVIPASYGIYTFIYAGKK